MDNQLYDQLLLKIEEKLAHERAERVLLERRFDLYQTQNSSAKMEASLVKLEAERLKRGEGPTAEERQLSKEIEKAKELEHVQKEQIEQATQNRDGFDKKPVNHWDRKEVPLNEDPAKKIEEKREGAHQFGEDLQALLNSAKPLAQAPTTLEQPVITASQSVSPNQTFSVPLHQVQAADALMVLAGMTFGLGATALGKLFFGENTPDTGPSQERGNAQQLEHQEQQQAAAERQRQQADQERLKQQR